MSSGGSAACLVAKGVAMSARMQAVALSGLTAAFVFCLVCPCPAKEPRCERDYFERGLARAEAGDANGAIEDFTHAIALNSNARVLKKVKQQRLDLDSGQQSDLSEKVLIIDRFNALAYYNIGNLLMDQGRLSEALDNFNKAVRLDPRLGRAFNNRGYVRHLMGDVDGAARDFDKSVQLDPKNPYVCYNRGVFRYKIHDFAGAIADYTRAIEIDSRLAAIFHDRGSAYLAQGKFDEAYGDFDKAIELNPGLLVSYRNRGLVRIFQGRDAEAEADFAYYLRFAGDQKDTLEELVRAARESCLGNGIRASHDQSVIKP